MARDTWIEDEYKKLEKYMDEGLNPAEIARLLGRSYTATYHRCTKYASFRDNIKPFKPKTQQQSRPCLRCSTPFLSSGFGNRLCNSCVRLTAGYVVAVYN
jgi:hypothetical protein